MESSTRLQPDQSQSERRTWHSQVPTELFGGLIEGSRYGTCARVVSFFLSLHHEHAL